MSLKKGIVRQFRGKRIPERLDHIRAIAEMWGTGNCEKIAAEKNTSATDEHSPAPPQLVLIVYY